jgi:hypothetical protein
MQSIEHNLSLFELMLDELESYLLTSEVFWALSKRTLGSIPLPRLTLGGLMLILDELTAQTPEMKPKQKMRHERMLRKYDRTSLKWRVALEKKAVRELNSRLNLWRAYIQDVEEQSESIMDYPQEVRNRVMIEHLMNTIGSHLDLKVEIQAINALDHRIKDFVIPGKFLWDDPLQNIYPQEDFPYLYVSPRISFSDRSHNKGKAIC